MDHYIILAAIMRKLDLNLKKSRLEFVPEMISETQFWRNYFYKIELLKKELGLSHRLTEKQHSGSGNLPVASTEPPAANLVNPYGNTETLRQAASMSAPNEIQLKTLSASQAEQLEQND